MAKARKPSAASKKRQPPFNLKEIGYIEKHYGKKSPESIAKHLGRPIKSIIQKAWKLGLSKSKPRIRPVFDPFKNTGAPPTVTDLSNPFIRPIPESAKPGQGRLVTFGDR